MDRTPRRYPRFRAALPVELRAAAVNAPLRAQTQDIGMGGLYVEMSLTQQTSTEVEIVLWIGDNKVSAKGVVVSSHPSFGNGIKFTDLPEESREKLRRYLDSLAGAGIGRGVGSR